MRFIQKFAVVMAGAVMSLSAAKTNPAEAATITYNFSLTPYAWDGEQETYVKQKTTYDGFFSFDDTTLIGPYTFDYPGEFPTYYEAALSTFNFDFIDATGVEITYTEADFDIDNKYGWVQLWGNGEITLSVGLYKNGMNLSFNNWISLTGHPQFWYFSDNAPEYGYASTVSYSQAVPPSPKSTPEPGILGGLAVFSLSSLFLKKKLVRISNETMF